MGQIALINKNQRALIRWNDIASDVQAILDEGTSENTKKAYRGDIQYFMAWAHANFNEIYFPISVPVMVKFIIDHLKGMDNAVEQELIKNGVKSKEGPNSLNTICRRIASISAAHEAKKIANPCRSKEVRTLLSKARRASVKKGETLRKRKALTRDLLELLISTCDDSLIGIRDKALLLFGFSSGGRRRSEVTSAMMKDLTPLESGFIYHLPYSKTDQEGAGLDLPILGKAAVALDAWLKASCITDGRLFRGVTKGGKITEQLSDKAVARIVKKQAALAGLDASLFSGHSLRSGFVTEAGRQGKSLGDTMAMSGHKTVRIAMGYHQAGNILNNPAAMLLD